MESKAKIISIILILSMIMNVFISLLFNNVVFAVEQTISVEIDKIDEAKYPGIKSKIKELQAQYPKWTFKLLYTGLDWYDAIDKEYEGHGSSPKNLIYNSDAYQGEWICSICGDTEYDNGNWKCASEQTVKYLMDPRNLLNEINVFQLEELSNAGADIETLKTMTSDSFLSGHEEGIIEVARNKNINPYYIVARLIQEQGKSGTVLTKGEGYNGQYEGYYNAFNIAASGNGTAQILTNGLAYAEKKGWDTLEKSIEGGISFLANNYVNKGQNTLYLQKFDVASEGGLYSNQYMQNILAPQSEGTTLKNMYANIDYMDQAHTFIVPVYENMPKEDSPRPNAGVINTLSGDYVKVNVDSVLMVRNAPAGDGIIGYLYPNEIVERLEKANSKVNGTYWDKIKKSNGTIGYSARQTYDGESNFKQYLIDIGTQNNSDTTNTEDKKERAKLDEENKIIFVVPDATAQDILDLYGGPVKITKANKEYLNGPSDLACTGFIVEDKYTVIKMGDTNGDGYVDTGDTFTLKRVLLGLSKLENKNFESAADINNDGYVDTGDTFLLKKQLLGLSNITL